MAIFHLDHEFLAFSLEAIRIGQTEVIIDGVVHYADSVEGRAALDRLCEVLAPLPAIIGKAYHSEDAEATAWQAIMEVIRTGSATLTPGAFVTTIRRTTAKLLGPQAHPISIPSSVLARVRKVLTSVDGDVDEAWRVFQAAHAAGQTVDLEPSTFLAALRALGDPASLDDPESPEATGLTLPTDRHEDVEEWAAWARMLVDNLPNPSRTIVELLYGFDTPTQELLEAAVELGLDLSEPLTTREIATLFGAIGAKMHYSTISRAHRAAIATMRLEVEAHLRGITTEEARNLLQLQADNLGITLDDRLAMSPHHYLLAIAEPLAHPGSLAA